MSRDAYLRWERAASDKHEYHGGKAWSMSGASYEHSAIATDTRRALGNLLEGSACDVLDSDMRVYVPATGQYYYPDACLVCGEPRVDNDKSLRNPVAIVKLLSPSTAAYDRGEKFEDFQRIESLQYYILIEQDRVSVTHYEKIADNLWAIVALSIALTDSLTLLLDDTVVTVPLAKIYRRAFAGDDPATA